MKFNLGRLFGRGEETAEEQYRFARRYESERDAAGAVRLYREAAEQGYAAAQFNLANCYRDGTGVAKDPAEAMRRTEKAYAAGAPRHTLS